MAHQNIEEIRHHHATWALPGDDTNGGDGRRGHGGGTTGRGGGRPMRPAAAASEWSAEGVRIYKM
jgi:hypothetical protein